MNQASTMLMFKLYSKKKSYFIVDKVVLKMKSVVWGESQEQPTGSSWLLKATQLIQTEDSLIFYWRVIQNL